MWEGIDQPLDDGNWPVVAPSPLPYRAGVNQVPRELTAAELAEIKAEFVDAARRADDGRLRPARAALRARLPAVELHLAAHQPAHRRVRRRRWRTGCATRSRCSPRCATVWPAGEADDRAHLGHRLGRRAASTGDDAVEIARAFAARRRRRDRRVDRARSRPDERPAFGRSYQTPVRRRDPQPASASRPSRSARSRPTTT